MSEQGETLARLLVAPDEGAASVIRARLQSEGIPSWQHTDSMFLGVWGASAPHATAVRVRQSDLERARATLEESRRESPEIDWTEVDVGEPEDELSARIAGRSEERQRPRRFRPGPILIWTVVLIFGLLYGGTIGVAIMIGCLLAAFFAALRKPAGADAHGV